MSTENNEDRNLSLAGTSPDHPANAGAIGGMHLASVPPQVWPKAKAKAEWEEAKERAVQEEPSTFSTADQFARRPNQAGATTAAQGQVNTATVAAEQVAGAAGTAQAGDAAPLPSKVRKARTTKVKDQAPDVADGAQQADVIVKPARKSRATAKAAEAGSQVEPADTAAAKPVRSRRRGTTKTAETNEQGTPKVGLGPIRDVDIPPITPEAITFLSDPDAKAADLFKLQPESQAFVRYHITNMHRLEAASALDYSYLMSKAPKYSPAFEKVADALIAKLDKDRRDGVKPVIAPPTPAAPHVSGAFYGPRQEQVGTYQTISVQLGKMEIGPSSNPAREQDASAAMEKARAAGNATTRSVSKAGEQDAENTIERGIARERVNQSAKGSQQSSPSIDPVVADVTQSAPAKGLGRRMLRAMGAWLQAKAEDEPAPAPGAKPESLDKSAAPVTSAEPESLHKSAAQATPADDKANLVPDAVARRFLKVERDYYFTDKTPAFSDRGNKLATRGAAPEVVRSLIEIAQARGWDSITVKGTDEFRRSAWMEATQAGLKVAGYKPTALDLAELANKPATNTVEKRIAMERDAAQPGKAAAAQASQGAATKAAGTAPSPELAAKARAFEKEKPGFVVKKHPELAQAYGVVDAAKKFAEANLSEEVRDEFVSLARRHVMQKILTGEQVKGPQIYAAPAKNKEVAEQTQTPAQAPVDLGKFARSKEVVRER